MRILKIFPILLAFYEIVTYLSNDMYLPALPQIAQDLMTTDALAQLSLTTWFLGAASMQLILGPVSDRYGRRPVILIGGIFFVIASLACAMTHDITIMLVARFLQGCAVCSVTVAGYATIHELYDANTAIKALALMGSITVLAPAFGPLAGSVFLQFANWRMMFGFLALWAIVILFILYRWMPESSAPENRSRIEPKTLLHNYYLIFSNRNFMLYSLIFCSTFTGMIAWIAMGPFLVIEQFHYSAMIFGLFQVLVFGSFIIGARCVKYGLEQFGVNKLIVIGILLALAGATASVVTAGLLPNRLIYFIISLMIFTFANAQSFAALQRLAVQSSDAPMGTRMAVFSTLMGGAGVLGSALASTFYTGTSLSLAYITFVSVLCAGFLRLLIKKL